MLFAKNNFKKILFLVPQPWMNPKHGKPMIDFEHMSTFDFLKIYHTHGKTLDRFKWLWYGSYHAYVILK